MSDEKLVTWVNGCLDKTVPDWTDSWSSGQLYIDLITHFRPDLTKVKTKKLEFFWTFRIFTLYLALFERKIVLVGFENCYTGNSVKTFKIGLVVSN